MIPAAATDDAQVHAGEERRGPEHPHRPLLEEELELERRVRTRFRAAERRGLQWSPRPTNQRYVAQRHGTR
jgi:hypothetical protein